MSNYPKAKIPTLKPNRKAIRVAIVYAQFNQEITKKILRQCIKHLRTQKIEAINIFCEEVAGALEIPVALSWCRKYYKADALIAIGCVIRGETYHFEVVSNTSAIALANLSIEINTPIINGILTCENEKQAKARIAPVAKHIAQSAVAMANLKFTLKEKQKAQKKIVNKNKNEKTAQRL